MAYHRGEVSLPQHSEPGGAATASNYYVDFDGKANQYFADLNATHESLKYTVLKTKFTEVQERYLRADVVASSIIYDVADSTFEEVLAPATRDHSSNDLLRCDAKRFEVRMRYTHLVARLNSWTLKCDTRWSVTRKRSDDIIGLRASLDTSKDD